MQQATEELIKKMQDDKGFAEQILTCKENDEAIFLAKEQGIDLTLENIVEVNEVLQFAQRQEEGELTEEELEQVAGGGTIEWMSLAVASPTLLPMAVALSPVSVSVLAVGTAVVTAVVASD